MPDEKLLLDTNIVSYLLKQKPEAPLYLPLLEGKLLCISFVTVGELLFWAEDARWGTQRRSQLEHRLRNYVVIPYDFELAEVYARVAAERKKKGLPISSNDAWIAACALRHDMPLVTHNMNDFLEIEGLKLITRKV